MPYTTLVAGTTITSSWANTNVRDQVVTPFADTAARSSAIPSPVEGMVSYLNNTNFLDFYDGSVWRPVTGAAARVVRTGSQLIPTGTVTAITWQQTSYDSHGMWSGVNPTRLTAPWTGIYCVSATLNWESLDSGTYRRAFLSINGTVQEANFFHSQSTLNSIDDFRQNLSMNGMRMTAGQYVELESRQNTGLDRNVSPTITNMKMVYVGPST